MMVIGLTGGIGSGKSTVAKILAGLGAAVIDADVIGRDIMEKEDEVKKELAEVFGQSVLEPGWKIDRKKLAEIVFRQPKALSRLNKIMHPRIAGEVKRRLEDYRRRGTGTVVLEAPLLVEAGWASQVDRVWVTTAPRDVIIERLETRGMTRKEAVARIRSQVSDEERMKHADTIIDTGCSIEGLKKRAEGVWRDAMKARGK